MTRSHDDTNPDNRIITSYPVVLDHPSYSPLSTTSGENAITERVNGILKQEFLNHYEFVCIEEVSQAVTIAVNFYNTKRPHRSINILTPQKAAMQEGKTPKKWISHQDRYAQNSQP